MSNQELPLLLLDNISMSQVVNEGEFKCAMLTFEEAKAIIEMQELDDVVRCFRGDPLEEVVFKYLDINGARYPYKKFSNMRPGQHAIVFKTYVTPSETQPIIETAYGCQAKKIQNIYVYCQHIVKL